MGGAPESSSENIGTSLNLHEFFICLQMFEWISHNRDLFLVNYTEIGTCHQMAGELESEHCQFATSAEVCNKCPSLFLLG